MNELFSNLTEQIREATPRNFGVIDGQGTVLASSGRRSSLQFGAAAATITAADGQNAVYDGYSFRLPDPHEEGDAFEYAVYVEGVDEHAYTVAILAGIALRESKSYDAEKIDKALFLKNLISDNTLLSELFTRAQELRIPLQARRCVFLIRQTDRRDPLTVEVIRGLYPDKQKDFIFMVSDTDAVLIKEFDNEPASGFDDESDEYEAVARQIIEALSVELFVQAVIGIGSTSHHLRELPERYKESQVAIEVGKVFSDEKNIMRYDNLGIARIIYQLPNTLCERFLSEVFKKNSIDTLEAETLYTINKFFENNLNVSETSRKLFVHRNTLVYRLEKIKKLTGLDLREFDHAIVFKVALMVRRYLDSQ
ncbi:MAG: helix-turn-helix domain-containing protein [Oscillospiraceae bacterium]|jgi:carbohydrate diacid regulator|nr:helix-turn-helix domain-containing protein [Oscillospiraceae bacterium]